MVCQTEFETVLQRFDLFDIVSVHSGRKKGERRKKGMRRQRGRRAPNRGNILKQMHILGTNRIL